MKLRDWTVLFLGIVVLGCQELDDPPRHVGNRAPQNVGQHRGRSEGVLASRKPGRDDHSSLRGTENVPPAANDVLERVRSWQIVPLPIAAFRSGNASAGGFEGSTERTPEGFRIQMPAHSPIPTPTVVGDRLLVSGGFTSQEYYCFHAVTGEFIWGASLDDDGPSQAVVSQGVVVFNTESCTLFALDSDTGEHLWSHWLGDPLMSAPTVANRRVFTVYPTDQEVSGGAARDTATEELPAGHATAEGLSSSERMDKPIITRTVEGILPVPTHVLAAFDLKSGSLVWRRRIDTDCLSAPVALGERLYVTSLSGMLYEFDQADGSIISAHQVWATSPPTIAGDHLYYTRRIDPLNDPRPVCEAIIKQHRRHHGPVLTAAARSAPYLDWRVQIRANSALEAAGFEGANGIGGGFGGGFGTGSGAGGGFFNTADLPGETPGPQTGGHEEVADRLATLRAPPQDLLAYTERVAAEVIGQGNVSTIQTYGGSRIEHSIGRIYNCMGDRIICASADAGDVVWALPLDGDLEEVGGHLAAPPVLADGRLYVATLSGKLHEVDAETGRIRMTHDVGAEIRFAPVVVAGRAYVSTQDGQVVCIDLNRRRP